MAEQLAGEPSVLQQRRGGAEQGSAGQSRAGQNETQRRRGASQRSLLGAVCPSSQAGSQSLESCQGAVDVVWWCSDELTAKPGGFLHGTTKTAMRLAEVSELSTQHSHEQQRQGGSVERRL